MDENELVRKLKANDPLGWEEFLNRYQERIIRFLVKTLAIQHEVAEDVFSDLLSTLITNKLGNYNVSLANLQTWLFTIAENRFIDVYRKEHMTLRRGMGFKRAASDFSRLPERKAESAHDVAAKREMPRICDDLLSRVGSKQALYLRLYYFDGLSQEEVAKVCGDRVATVKADLYRARRRILKSVLKQMLGAELDGITAHDVQQAFRDIWDLEISPDEAAAVARDFGDTRPPKGSSGRSNTSGASTSPSPSSKRHG